MLTKTGAKFDEGKPDYSILPLKDLEPVIRVLMVGREKHGEHNWKEATDLNQFIAPLLRHLAEFQAGNYVDESDNTLHIAKVAVNAMFLMRLMELRK